MAFVVGLLRPRISLLHATRGRSGRALSARQKWLDAAAHPGRVEHRFAIDADDEDSRRSLAAFSPLVVPTAGGGCVAAWNFAARVSRGAVLIQLSDDWLPVQGWDEEIAGRLGDPGKPRVLRVHDGHRDDDLLCMAILTRGRFRQQRTFFFPGYTGLYSDDEFSFRACQDGVVIDGRDLVLKHEHPNYDSSILVDETYLRQNHAERELSGRRLFLQRNPRAKGHWIHDGEWRRRFVPLPPGEDWTVKPAAEKTHLAGPRRNHSALD